MSNLKERWYIEPKFIELYKILSDEDPLDEEFGITPERFKNLPIVSSVVSKHDLLDCKEINLSRRVFNKVWMGHNLENSNFTYCRFKNTGFHNAEAKLADFSNSNFDYSGMNPFYAPGANFENCIFDTCSAFGCGSNKHIYGHLNDFSQCCFKHVKAHKTGFSRSDFTGADFSGATFTDCDINNSVFKNANFTGAKFIDCTFIGGDPVATGRDNQCDFRGCNLEDTQFVRCDFAFAIFDDTSQVRKVVLNGNNLNCNTVIWYSSSQQVTHNLP